MKPKLSNQSDKSEHFEFYFKDIVIITCSVLLLSFAISKNLEVKEKLLSERNKLNITGNCNDSLLVFNRVPKVGSQTLNQLIGELRHRNNFRGYTSVEGMPSIDDSEMTYLPEAYLRKSTVEALVKMEGAFLKHQNFLNFSEFDPTYSSPIYMNFVRDPVERLISWYYYIRNPLYQFDEDLRANTTKYKPAVSIDRLKTSIEDCIERGNIPDCKWLTGASLHQGRIGGSHGSQMTFFCGHLPICDQANGEENFKMAIRNVDKHFAVVGVLEEWDKSLKVLEHFVPRYFEGSREVFAGGKVDKVANKNLYKPKTSALVRELIAKNITKEIEFYNFCKQRLHKQYLAIL